MMIYYGIKWLIENTIDLLGFIAWNIARFTVWLITARDCKRCQYGNRHWRIEETLWTECCYKKYREASECLNSIHRKHFKRKR